MSMVDAVNLERDTANELTIGCMASWTLVGIRPSWCANAGRRIAAASELHLALQGGLKSAGQVERVRGRQVVAVRICEELANYR